MKRTKKSLIGQIGGVQRALNSARRRTRKLAPKAALVHPLFEAFKQAKRELHVARANRRRDHTVLMDDMRALLAKIKGAA